MRVTPKLFTVEEANRLLPQVKRILHSLRGRGEKIRRLEQKKAVEELSWLREDGTVSPRAREAVASLEESLDEQSRAFEGDLEHLASIGAQLKNLEEGLVDFFTARGDELVYLCWREGEDQIRYWHDLESGFPGRQPLEKL